MINFACKTINLEEIIMCSFNIKKTEYKIMNYLLKEKEAKTIKEITKTIGLERSTVQKAIKELTTKKIVNRKQKNNKKGGYKYYYEIREKEEIRKKLREIISKWCENTIKAINEW